MLIDVPVYRQEEEWSCLAACIRMCMDAAGDRLPESDWRACLGLTKRGGTLEQAHAILLERGIESDLLIVSTVDDLDARVSVGSPTILGVRLGSPGAMPTYHAVVLTGCVGEDYLVNDPAEGARVLWKRNDLMRAIELAGGWALAMPAV